MELLSCVKPIYNLALSNKTGREELTLVISESVVCGIVLVCIAPKGVSSHTNNKYQIHKGNIYFMNSLLDCIIMYSGLSALGWLSLFFGIRHPGARFERVCGACGILADLLLAKTGGGCMALGQSPCRCRHQTVFVFLSL